MIKFGGEVKIYAMSSFSDINIVIDEMIILNKESNFFKKEEILKFCRFQVNHRSFSNSVVYCDLVENEYDDFFSVEDEIYNLDLEDEILSSEKLINTNQKLIFNIRSHSLINYRLSLLFSVALANTVDGIIDLISYPSFNETSKKNKFLSKDWESYVFQLLNNNNLQ